MLSYYPLPLNNIWSQNLLWGLKLSFPLLSPAEQLDELKKQLERERNLKFEEATKELDNVKLDVESRRRDLEARQRKVEAVVAEVLSTSVNLYT